MERIYRYRMTTTSGGNLSIREENGDIWITPARVDKGVLRRSDICPSLTQFADRGVRGCGLLGTGARTRSFLGSTDGVHGQAD
jgi:hypothetical protein